MGLKFAPLGWIYHDGWKYNETKTLVDTDESGNPVITDSSKTCHQKGHVHLFLPTVPFSREGSTKAYWGEQSYQFSITDEWGPNSGDPSQNQSVRLIGKPVWYFHIEEYWRRFYIQPWDTEDDTCTYPLNQECPYDRKDALGYSHETIASSSFVLTDTPGEHLSFPDMHYSVTYDGSYTRRLDGLTNDEIDHGGFVFIGFNDYLIRSRRTAARSLYVQQESTRAFVNAFLASKYPSCLAVSRDGELHVTSEEELEYIQDYRHALLYVTVEDGVTAVSYGDMPDAEAVEFASTRQQEFEEFYLGNASLYGNYTDERQVIRDFMDENGVSFPEGTKYSTDGTVLVPSGKKTGHAGIKYDASKPCHSLGPFMEGGEFHFFNTCVNRAMPCEYWLDAERKTRQYFIRHLQDGYETSGGGTWTFGDASRRFVFVENAFSEAQGLLGDDYEEDTGSLFYSGTMRYPNILSVQHYTCHGMNAKRLRDDLSATLDGSPHSENAFMPKGIYQHAEQDKSSHKDTSSPWKVDYGENGWTVRDERDPLVPEEQREVMDGAYIGWESDGWTGWYAYGEAVMSSSDGCWYRRTWKPYRYSESAPFSGTHPHWGFAKRQSFPNPSPFLCDRPDGHAYESYGQLPDIHAPFSHWCTEQPFQTDEENRVHLLRWQYALYFNLSRQYPSQMPHDPVTVRRHFFIYADETGNSFEEAYSAIQPEDIDSRYAPPRQGFVMQLPADWETAVEEYTEQYGQPSSYDEQGLFDSWMASLRSYRYFEPFEDKDGYWTDDTEIQQKDIIEGDRYVIRDEQGNITDTRHLPPRQYRVSESSRPGMYSMQTYLTFGEFATVWTLATGNDLTAITGDTPQRNTTPFQNDAYIQGIYPPSQSPEEQQFKQDHTQYLLSHSRDDAAPSLILSEFFPRTDQAVRNYNASSQTQYSPSPLDEAGDLSNPQDGTLAKVLTDGTPFDPYRNGTVDPIRNWKRFFSKREQFTIPENTTAGGDSAIQNSKGTPHYHTVHPRETSYSTEDGARNQYPDELFITPVIEYQKVTYDGRLPDKQDEEQYFQTHWKHDTNPTWGDGFSVNVTIPLRKNGEILSPFSQSNNSRTTPPGTYCHNTVKPEDKLRYHVEFYDSLDKIRTFDFPNYINIIRTFQLRFMPPPPVQQLPQFSYYHEDFNDYNKTLQLRKAQRSPLNPLPGLPDEFNSWQECIDDYWMEINGNKTQPKQNIFIDQPITKNTDCYGNTTAENAFTTLNDGTLFWREQTTHNLPDKSTLEFTPDGKPGFIDSNGNYVKAGGTVQFNDPYNKNDGVWMEQCLGATVKATCCLILEDALGYRWMQTESNTALSTNQPLSGNDYEDY